MRVPGLALTGFGIRVWGLRFSRNAGLRFRVGI